MQQIWQESATANRPHVSICVTKTEYTRALQPWDGGLGWPPRNTSPPHLLSCQVWWFRSNGMSIITEICRKNLTPRVPLFKVTGTDTDQSATYDFLLVSLHFNGNFPGVPWLASTRMSPFCILLELKVTEVVVTTGAIRRAKLQSKCYHQQINTQFFYRPDALRVAQPTVSNHSNLYSFRDKWQFQSKIADFSNPRVTFKVTLFNAPSEWVPLGICNRGIAKKKLTMPLTDGGKTEDMCI